MKWINKLFINKKKIFLFFIIIVFFWIWKDYKKIDVYFVNQSKVTYDIKNVNSNLLKKIHKFYNKLIENFLVTYFENHKKYWDLDNYKREELPEYKILTSKKIFTISDNNNPINNSNWERSHGNNSSNRFSNLKKINNNNA